MIPAKIENKFSNQMKP